MKPCAALPSSLSCFVAGAARLSSTGGGGAATASRCFAAASSSIARRRTPSRWRCSSMRARAARSSRRSASSARSISPPATWRSARRRRRDASSSWCCGRRPTTSCRSTRRRRWRRCFARSGTSWRTRRACGRCRPSGAATCWRCASRRRAPAGARTAPCVALARRDDVARGADAPRGRRLLAADVAVDRAGALEYCAEARAPGGALAGGLGGASRSSCPTWSGRGSRSSAAAAPTAARRRAAGGCGGCGRASARVGAAGLGVGLYFALRPQPSPTADAVFDFQVH